ETVSGRTVLRRLNRREYENTVRDLLHIDADLRNLLPEDTPMHGFDTVANGLRFSQLQIESYLHAASVAVDDALDLREPPERLLQQISLKNEKEFRENLDTPEGTLLDPDSGEEHRVIFRETDDAVVLFAQSLGSGGDLVQLRIPADGRYRFRVAGYAVASSGEPVGLEIFAHRFQGMRPIGFFQMPAKVPRVVEFEALLREGERINLQPHATDFDEDGRSVWEVGAARYTGRGLAVQSVQLEGPLNTWPLPSLTRLVGEFGLRELPESERVWQDERRVGYTIQPSDPEAALEEILTRFATQCFRRPLEPGEASPFIRSANKALAEERGFAESLKMGLRALLVAPQFLLIDEPPGQLNAFAVATRLSYFLTSSMPDDELFAAARDGSILTKSELHKQTERLLSSRSGERFIRDFTGQWLDLSRIDATSPDLRLYPEFDPVLQRSMVAESEAFFRELVTHDLDVSNIIDSDFLMLNRTMAKHYGISGVDSEEFRRIAIPDNNPRGGVLTQASVLKVTANGTVTSPVMRGAWILSKILRRPTRPPPPNVGSVEPDTRGAQTIRDLLSKHRDSDSCASCHQHIDPPGFALESFDVIGGWRDRYRTIGEGDPVAARINNRGIWEYRLGQPVDSSGRTSDGSAFRNIQEYKDLLMQRRESIHRAMAESLAVYATGAAVRFSDRKAIESIVERSTAAGGGMRTLIHTVIQSPLFLNK
ncbi:MAG TPA: hypothetical protein DDW52_00505, partial [Planctomycetaceae bacterium]|nr:hypothetical protein [Planctomycetaceae bacterium]